MHDLSGRTALVTGGAQGIGFGISTELASAGCRVIITGRHLQKSEAAAAELRRNGNEVLALPLDITSDASVKNCVTKAVESCERIDILVNNAGMFQSRLGLDLSAEEFNHCLDVNLTGAWRMVRALVPHLRKYGGGRIVNIASAGGRKGEALAPAYCASKAAMINLSQSLAAALGEHHINVNTVCPGAVATPMRDEIKALLGDPAAGALQATYPLATLLTASDVGRAVVFLVSDHARNITGQALNVDRGFRMN